MGWQETGDSWPGGTPGRDPGPPGRPGLPGLPAGSVTAARGPGRPVRRARGRPGARRGAGRPVRRRRTDALVGIARQWAAVESWAAAGKLAALRAMTREDGDGSPRLRRRPDLPDGWDDSLTYEVSGALAMGPVSAGNLATLAWTLGTRLAGTGRLLADGHPDHGRRRSSSRRLFEPLDDSEAARAEALILGELPGKTYPQVERLAWRAALAVAPDAAERRRQRRSGGPG